MNIEFKEPDMRFNPVTVDNLRVIENTQVRLRPVKRYVSIDRVNKIISLYVDLTDGNVLLTVPIKYYEWVAIMDSTTVICDYYKMMDGNNTYSCVEINKFDKVNVQIISGRVNVFEEGNRNIPETYAELYKEDSESMLVLNNYRRGLVCGIGVGYIKDGQVRVNSICKVDNLTSRSGSTLEHNYRKIMLDDEEYLVDVELVRKGSTDKEVM